jgi:homoserine dehydrogenase
LDIVRNDDAAVPPFMYGPKKRVRAIRELGSRYYVRLTTVDRPGILGRACTILGDHGVSIASCIQKEEHTPENVHIVMMTHRAQESAVRDAVSEIDALPDMRESTHVIRVLED